MWDSLVVPVSGGQWGPSKHAVLPNLRELGRKPKDSESSTKKNIVASEDVQYQQPWGYIDLSTLIDDVTMPVIKSGFDSGGGVLDIKDFVLVMLRSLDLSYEDELARREILGTQTSSRGRWGRTSPVEDLINRAVASSSTVPISMNPSPIADLSSKTADVSPFPLDGFQAKASNGANIAKDIYIAPWKFQWQDTSLCSVAASKWMHTVSNLNNNNSNNNNGGGSPSGLSKTNINLNSTLSGMSLPPAPSLSSASLFTDDGLIEVTAAILRVFRLVDSDARGWITWEAFSTFFLDFPSIAAAAKPPMTLSSGNMEGTVRQFETSVQKSQALSSEVVDKLTYIPQLDLLAVIHSHTKSLELLNPITLAPKVSLEGLRGTPTSVTYCDAWDYLVTTAADKSVALWAADSDRRGSKSVLDNSHSSSILRRGRNGGSQGKWSGSDFLMRQRICSQSIELSSLWLQNSSLLVTGGLDGAVRLWDVQKLTGVADSDGVNAVSRFLSGLSSREDSDTAADAIAAAASSFMISNPYRHSGPIHALCSIDDVGLMASAGDDRQVLLWDLPTMTAIRSLRAHKKTVTSLSYSAATRALFTSGLDQDILAWNPYVVKTPIFRLKGHAHALIGAEVIPDTHNAVSVDVGGGVRFWDLRTCRSIQSFSGSDSLHDAGAFSLMSKHGRLAVSTHSTIRVFAMEGVGSGADEEDLNGTNSRDKQSQLPLYSSSKNKSTTYSNSNESAYNSSIGCDFVCCQSESAIFQGNRRTICVWSSITGKLEQSFIDILPDGLSCLTLLNDEDGPGGGRLAIGMTSGLVGIFRSADLQPIRWLMPHSAEVSSLSPFRLQSGRMGLMSAAWDGVVRLHTLEDDDEQKDATSGISLDREVLERQVNALKETLESPMSSAAVRRALSNLAGLVDKKSFSDVSSDKDSKSSLSSALAGSISKLPQPIFKGFGNSISITVDYEGAAHPSASRLATGQVAGNEDNQDDALRSFEAVALSDKPGITCLAVAEDQSLAFIASGESVIVWNVSRGSRDCTLNEFGFSITSMAYLKEMALLAVADSSGLISLWSTPLAQFRLGLDEQYQCVFAWENLKNFNEVTILSRRTEVAGVPTNNYRSSSTPSRLIKYALRQSMKGQPITPEAPASVISMMFVSQAEVSKLRSQPILISSFDSPDELVIPPEFKAHRRPVKQINPNSVRDSGSLNNHTTSGRAKRSTGTSNTPGDSGDATSLANHALVRNCLFESNDPALSDLEVNLNDNNGAEISSMKSPRDTHNADEAAEPGGTFLTENDALTGDDQLGEQQVIDDDNDGDEDNDESVEGVAADASDANSMLNEALESFTEQSSSLWSPPCLGALYTLDFSGSLRLWDLTLLFAHRGFAPLPPSIRYAKQVRASTPSANHAKSHKPAAGSQQGENSSPTLHPVREKSSSPSATAGDGGTAAYSGIVAAVIENRMIRNSLPRYALRCAVLESLARSRRRKTNALIRAARKGVLCKSGSLQIGKRNNINQTQILNNRAVSARNFFTSSRTTHAVRSNMNLSNGRNSQYLISKAVDPYVITAFGPEIPPGVLLDRLEGFPAPYANDFDHMFNLKVPSESSVLDEHPFASHERLSYYLSNVSRMVRSGFLSPEINLTKSEVTLLAETEPCENFSAAQARLRLFVSKGSATVPPRLCVFTLGFNSTAIDGFAAAEGAAKNGSGVGSGPNSSDFSSSSFSKNGVLVWSSRLKPVGALGMNFKLDPLLGKNPNSGLNSSSSELNNQIGTNGLPASNSPHENVAFTSKALSISGSVPSYGNNTAAAQSNILVSPGSSIGIAPSWLAIGTSSEAHYADVMFEAKCMLRSIGRDTEWLLRSHGQRKKGNSISGATMLALESGGLLAMQERKREARDTAKLLGECRATPLSVLSKQINAQKRIVTGTNNNSLAIQTPSFITNELNTVVPLGKKKRKPILYEGTVEAFVSDLFGESSDVEFVDEMMPDGSKKPLVTLEKESNLTIAEKKLKQTVDCLYRGIPAGNHSNHRKSINGSNSDTLYNNAINDIPSIMDNNIHSGAQFETQNYISTDDNSPEHSFFSVEVKRQTCLTVDEASSAYRLADALAALGADSDGSFRSLAKSIDPHFALVQQHFNSAPSFHAHQPEQKQSQQHNRHKLNGGDSSKRVSMTSTSRLDRGASERLKGAARGVLSGNASARTSTTSKR